MNSKLIYLTVVLCFVALPTFAAVPNLQIDCVTISKNQNRVHIQLEEGFVYDSLKFNTKHTKKSRTLLSDALQTSSIDESFSTDIKSVTLTYQDVETQTMVSQSEDIQCEPAQIPSSSTEDLVVPTEFAKITSINGGDSIPDEYKIMKQNTPEEVSASSDVKPEEANAFLTSGNESLPSVETNYTDILATDAPQTSAQILSIESNFKTNTKNNLDAKYTQKKAVSDEEYDFSEDIQDF